MFEAIAEAFPRTIAALRRRGMSRADAAGLILAARYGDRATVWTATDCGQARRMIARAFYCRRRLATVGGEG